MVDLPQSENADSPRGVRLRLAKSPRPICVFADLAAIGYTAVGQCVDDSGHSTPLLDEGAAELRPYQFDKPPELRIGAVVLPSIYKAADDLQVSSFIVTVTIDAVERTYHLWIVGFTNIL